MKLFGRIHEITDMETGQSANGEWQRRTLVIQSLDNPNQLTAIDALNERVKQLENLQVGMAVEVNFSASSRKRENKWYSNLSLWEVSRI